MSPIWMECLINGRSSPIRELSVTVGKLLPMVTGAIFALTIDAGVAYIKVTWLAPSFKLREHIWLWQDPVPPKDQSSMV